MPGDLSLDAATSTSSASSRSSALRAIGPPTDSGPCVRRLGAGGTCPPRGTSPKLGLCPKMPQKCDGMRIEPAMSLPSSSDVNPAATAAAGPPDDPPGVLERSHGLLVVPYTGL